MSDDEATRESRSKRSKNAVVEAEEPAKSSTSSKRGNFAARGRASSAKDVKASRIEEKPSRPLFDDSALPSRRSKKESDSSSKADVDAPAAGSMKHSSSKSKLKDGEKSKDNGDESTGKSSESSTKRQASRASSSKDLKANTISSRSSSSSKDKVESSKDKKSSKSSENGSSDLIRASSSAGELKSPRGADGKKEKEKSKSKRTKTSDKNVSDEPTSMVKDESSESLAKSNSSTSLKEEKPVIVIPALDTTPEVVETAEPSPKTPKTPKEALTAALPAPITPRDTPLPAPITPRASEAPLSVAPAAVALPAPITPRVDDAAGVSSPPSPTVAPVAPAPVLADTPPPPIDASAPPPSPIKKKDDNEDSDTESDKKPATAAAAAATADSSTISVKRTRKVSKQPSESPSTTKSSRRGSATMRPPKSSSRRESTDSSGSSSAPQTSADTDSIPTSPSGVESSSPAAALAQHPVLRRTLSRGNSNNVAVPPISTTPTLPTTPASPRVSVSTPRTETPPPPSPSADGAPPPPPPPAPGMRRVTKKELLEVSERKVLTRLNIPRIDEEFKKWDRRASKYENVMQSERIQTDFLSDLLFFPHDGPSPLFDFRCGPYLILFLSDVYIETTKPLIGQLPDVDAETPKSVRDCMAFFAQPRKVIKYRSLKYGGRIPLRDRIKARDDERAKIRAAEASAAAAVAPPASPTITVAAEGDKKKGGDKKKHDKKKPSMSVSTSSPRPGTATPPPEVKPLAVSQTSTVGQEHPLSATFTGSTPPASPGPKNLAQMKLEGSTPRPERIRSASVGFESSEDASSSYVLLDDMLTLSDQTVLKARIDRDRACRGIFEAIPTSLASTEPTENRTEGRPITREYGTRVLLSMQDVHIGVGYEEAFFFSAAFYDFDKRLRLTEDFHFDFNESNDLIHTLLSAQQPNQEPESKAKRGLFNLSYTSSNVFLVVRVNGLLRGSADENLEAYTPGNQLNPKEKQKLIDQGRTAASIMAKYQQAYAWTAVRFFLSLDFLLWPG